MPQPLLLQRTERNVKIQQNHLLQVSFFQLHGACSDMCSICIKTGQASNDQVWGTSDCVLCNRGGCVWSSPGEATGGRDAISGSGRSLTAGLSHTLQRYRAGLAECGGQNLINWERLHTLACKIVYLSERHKNSLFLTSVIMSRMGVGERD